MNHATRPLALYLPQFHPVPENDEWWGPGFTEWTNVAKARSLYRGHEQPRIPGELGFYDLRVPETRAHQAELARSHGIEGFIYWHYWFAGRRLLHHPLAEILRSGEPEFPFCLSWANQTWTGVWYGEPDRVLVEQTYPGARDHARHFACVLPAFRDTRYITVDGRPVFFIFRPTELPDAAGFANQWRELADEAGLAGLHLVGFDHQDQWDPRSVGFDGAVVTSMNAMFGMRVLRPLLRLRRASLRFAVGRRINERIRKPLNVYPFDQVSELLIPTAQPEYDGYPCVIPNWDNTPRSGSRGSVMDGSTPDLFAAQVRRACEYLEPLPPDRRLMVIKSWNEWAEGNYMEPDRRWGRAYLEAFRDVVR